MLGYGKRIAYAFRCFFALLLRGEIPDDVARELAMTAPPATPAKASDQSSAIPKAAAERLATESFDRAVQVFYPAAARWTTDRFPDRRCDALSGRPAGRRCALRA